MLGVKKILGPSAAHLVTVLPLQSGGAVLLAAVGSRLRVYAVHQEKRGSCNGAANAVEASIEFEELPHELDLGGVPVLMGACSHQCFIVVTADQEIMVVRYQANLTGTAILASEGTSDSPRCLPAASGSSLTGEQQHIHSGGFTELGVWGQAVEAPPLGQLPPNDPYHPQATWVILYSGVAPSDVLNRPAPVEVPQLCVDYSGTQAAVSIIHGFVHEVSIEVEDTSPLDYLNGKWSSPLASKSDGGNQHHPFYPKPDGMDSMEEQLLSRYTPLRLAQLKHEQNQLGATSAAGRGNARFTFFDDAAVDAQHPVRLRYPKAPAVHVSALSFSHVGDIRISFLSPAATFTPSADSEKLQLLAELEGIARARSSASLLLPPASNSALPLMRNLFRSLVPHAIDDTGAVVPTGDTQLQCDTECSKAAKPLKRLVCARTGSELPSLVYLVQGSEGRSSERLGTMNFSVSPYLLLPASAGSLLGGAKGCMIAFGCKSGRQWIQSSDAKHGKRVMLSDSSTRVTAAVAVRPRKCLTAAVINRLSSSSVPNSPPGDRSHSPSSSSFASAISGECEAESAGDQDAAETATYSSGRPLIEAVEEVWLLLADNRIAVLATDVLQNLVNSMASSPREGAAATDSRWEYVEVRGLPRTFIPVHMQPFWLEPALENGAADLIPMETGRFLVLSDGIGSVFVVDTLARAVAGSIRADGSMRGVAQGHDRALFVAYSNCKVQRLVPGLGARTLCKLENFGNVSAVFSVFTAHSPGASRPSFGLPLTRKFGDFILVSRAGESRVFRVTPSSLEEVTTGQCDSHAAAEEGGTAYPDAPALICDEETLAIFQWRAHGVPSGDARLRRMLPLLQCTPTGVRYRGTTLSYRDYCKQLLTHSPTMAAFYNQHILAVAGGGFVVVVRIVWSLRPGFTPQPKCRDPSGDRFDYSKPPVQLQLLCSMAFDFDVSALAALPIPTPLGCYRDEVYRSSIIRRSRGSAADQVVWHMAGVAVVVLGRWDGVVEVRSACDLVLHRTLRTHAVPRALVYLPTAQFLAVSLSDGRVFLWDGLATPDEHGCRNFQDVEDYTPEGIARQRREHRKAMGQPPAEVYRRMRCKCLEVFGGKEDSQFDYTEGMPKRSHNESIVSLIFTSRDQAVLPNICSAEHLSICRAPDPLHPDDAENARITSSVLIVAGEEAHVILITQIGEVLDRVHLSFGNPLNSHLRLATVVPVPKSGDASNAPVTSPATWHSSFDGNTHTPFIFVVDTAGNLYATYVDGSRISRNGQGEIPKAPMVYRVSSEATLFPEEATHPTLCGLLHLPREDHVLMAVNTAGASYLVTADARSLKARDLLRLQAERCAISCLKSLPSRVEASLVAIGMRSMHISSQLGSLETQEAVGELILALGHPLRTLSRVPVPGKGVNDLDVFTRKMGGRPEDFIVTAANETVTIFQVVGDLLLPMCSTRLPGKCISVASGPSVFSCGMEDAGIAYVELVLMSSRQTPPEVAVAVEAATATAALDLQDSPAIGELQATDANEPTWRSQQPQARGAARGRGESRRRSVERGELGMEVKGQLVLRATEPLALHSVTAQIWFHGCSFARVDQQGNLEFVAVERPTAAEERAVSGQVAEHLGAVVGMAGSYVSTLDAGMRLPSQPMDVFVGHSNMTPMSEHVPRYMNVNTAFDGSWQSRPTTPRLFLPCEDGSLYTVVGLPSELSRLLARVERVVADSFPHLVRVEPRGGSLSTEITAVYSFSGIESGRALRSPNRCIRSRGIIDLDLVTELLEVDRRLYSRGFLDDQGKEVALTDPSSADDVLRAKRIFHTWALGPTQWIQSEATERITRETMSDILRSLMQLH